MRHRRLPSSRSRPGALVAALLTIAVVATGHRVSTTDAAWSDQAITRANFGSLKWSTTGSARGAAVTASMTITVLGSASVGPLGPAIVSNASPSTPGPVTSGAAVSAPAGINAGVVGGSVIANDTATSAQYRLTAADASASLTSIGIGISALSLPLLGDLVKFTSTTGHLDTSAACRANSATASASTDLASLRFGLLGAVPIPANVAGNTATATAVSLTALDLARVTVEATVTRSVTAVSAPTDPAASSSLTATVVVAVDTRLTLFGSWSTALGVVLTVPLVSSNCLLDLP